MILSDKRILEEIENGTIITCAVTIVLSGNNPYDIIKNENNRFAFIDDNLNNLNPENSSTIFMMASTNYSKILDWQGKGEIPACQKEKLIELINTAHQKGKKVRLWASPENVIVWEELLNFGVDFINTDNLQEFKEFFIYKKQ